MLFKPQLFIFLRNIFANGKNRKDHNLVSKMSLYMVLDMHNWSPIVNLLKREKIFISLNCSIYHLVANSMILLSKELQNMQKAII